MDTLEIPRALLDAWRGAKIRAGGAVLNVPGTRRIRLSVVAGNLRIHRLLSRAVQPGAVVVDVGANIGYNAVHAARLAGARGRVIAVEPTPDNLAVLHANVAACALAKLDVLRGMTRLLREPRTVLIVEWHPLLQQMAGFAPDALPRWLIERGFRLRAVSHTRDRALAAEQVPALTTQLLRRRGPVELFASRAE